MANQVARSFLYWTIYTIVLAILFHLAASVSSTTVIDVGEQPAATFLLRFWNAERSPSTSGSFSYQWTTDSSTIDLPTFKTADSWTIMLRGWMEPRVNGDGVWIAADGAAVHLPSASGIRLHQVLVPRLGPVSLVRNAPNPDPNSNVGLATDIARVSRLSPRMVLDWQLLLAAICLSAFLAFLVYTANMDRRDTLLILMCSAFVPSLALAAYPLYALRAIPPLVGSLTVVLGLGLCSFFWLARVRRSFPGYIIAALAAIVVLKAVGILYPNYIGVDTAYHIRGMQDVAQGRLYRIGGGAGSVFPYPPGVYVFLLPLTLLFGNADWMELQSLVLGASILIDSSTILLINHMLNHRLVQQRVRHWAVLLYICVPAGFILFWHATIAQNIGQWFLIAYLTVLIRCMFDDAPLTWVRIGLLIFLSLLASLGHFGVFVNFNLMFTLLVVLFPQFALRYRAIIATWVIGTAISIVLYYTVFWTVVADELSNQIQQSDSAPSRWFVLQRLVWSLGLHDHYLSVYVVLALVGVTILLSLRREVYFQVITRVIGAMLLTSTLLGLLQVAFLLNPTRYIIFSHTAIVIFSAYALGWLKPNWATWTLSRVLICVTLIWSLILWASAVALHAQRAWLS